MGYMLKGDKPKLYLSNLGPLSCEQSALIPTPPGHYNNTLHT